MMSWLATLVPLVLLILPLVVIVAAVVAFVVLRKKNDSEKEDGAFLQSSVLFSREEKFLRK